MLRRYAELSVCDLVEQLHPATQLTVVGLVLDKDTIIIQASWSDAHSFSQRQTQHDTRLASCKEIARRTVLQDDLFAGLDRLCSFEFTESLACFEDQPVALHKCFDG